MYENGDKRRHVNDVRHVMPDFQNNYERSKVTGNSCAITIVVHFPYGKGKSGGQFMCC